MAMILTQAEVDGLGYDLAAAVASYQVALTAHAVSVGEPAPVADPLVEMIVRAGGYEIEKPPTPPPIVVTAPDCSSLPYWRVALKLWLRDAGKNDGSTVARFDDVDASIKRLQGAPDLDTARIGMLAREQFEYANGAARADLLKIAPAFGFTAADVDESLWRAGQVAKGDLSGTWPNPAAQA